MISLSVGMLLSGESMILVLRSLAFRQTLMLSGPPSFAIFGAASNGRFHWQFGGALLIHLLRSHCRTLSETLSRSASGIGYCLTQTGFASPVSMLSVAPGSWQTVPI